MIIPVVLRNAVESDPYLRAGQEAGSDRRFVPVPWIVGFDCEACMHTQSGRLDDQMPDYQLHRESGMTYPAS